MPRRLCLRLPPIPRTHPGPLGICTGGFGPVLDRYLGLDIVRVGPFDPLVDPLEGGGLVFPGAVCSVIILLYYFIIFYFYCYYFCYLLPPSLLRFIE